VSDAQPDFIQLAALSIQGLQPYQPGKPIEELERELGISNVIKLASNENPLGMSLLAKQAVSGVLVDGARYPDGNGFILKSALCDYFLNKQQSVSADQLTLGNGSNDVLDIIMRAYANGESEVIFSQYAFAVYAISCQAVGAKAVVAPANSWGHDLTAMLSAITDKTKLVFIANPNNPTGTSISHGQLIAFMAKVPASVIVVLDEAYCEYIDEDEFPDGVSLLSLFSNLIVTRTFSKAWGLASLRVGYAISNAQIADVLNRVRQPFNVNSFALAAAAAVLQDMSYLDEGVELNRSGMIQVQNGLDELKLPYIPSKGNFITFNTCVDGLAVYQGLLREGVIVRPLVNYQMPSFLRVSIGLPEENRMFLVALSRVMSNI
jgi:histidinol-phosphate aminotransferase